MKTIDSWIEDASKNTLQICDDRVDLNVHVLISREDQFYTAHCLEFDIVADGRSTDDAKENILEAIVNHVSFCLSYGNMKNIINPAPSEYWHIFYFVSKKLGNPFRFPPDYQYDNQTLPFLNNMIKEIEFNESCINAETY